MICSDKKCNHAGNKDMNNGRGVISYCWMHHRIRQMRAKAKKKCKFVPSTEHLESLFKKIKDMICPCCAKDMIMHSDLGTMTDVVSLQHNADGTIALICFSCNSAHGQKPGDLYYDIPKGMKHCSRCDTIKTTTSFQKNRCTRDGLQAYCKKCYGEIGSMRREKAVQKTAGWHKAGEAFL